MDFIWKEFCSWYIELTKERIYQNEDMEAKNTAVYILLDVLEKSMRLLHPIMPFITEEIWQTLKIKLQLSEDVLITAAYPIHDDQKIQSEINDEMKYIQDSISAVRNLRKQVNIPPSKEVTVAISASSKDQIDLLKKYEKYFIKLAKVEDMTIEMNLEKPESAVATVVEDTEIYLLLSGLVDLAEERKKLQKQIDKLSKELNGIERKLSNQKFLAKAPEKIVKKEKEKYDEVKTKLDKTKEILSGL